MKAKRPNIPRHKIARAIARRERIAALLDGGVVLRADDLASILAVSKRTIYRDVEDLRDRGADIPGKVGTGYRLKARPSVPALAPPAPDWAGDPASRGRVRHIVRHIRRAGGA